MQRGTLLLKQMVGGIVVLFRDIDDAGLDKVQFREAGSSIRFARRKRRTTSEGKRR
jgi:hypothetical protein